MLVHVAFTPDEGGAAPTGIVIDVIRATSTMCQALDSGYERVFCTAEVEEARALRDRLGEGVLGGERSAVRIPGFDLGNSPGSTSSLPPRRSSCRRRTAPARWWLPPSAASASSWRPLLNLAAVVEETRRAGDDAIVVCAGVQGTLALDDAYVAGRIVDALGWGRTDAAEAAARLAATWGGAEEALRASKSGRNLLENAPELEPDIPFCARESVLDVVPRLVELRDGAAEISR